MNEKKYLFIFDDGSYYEMTCGISFKDALYEMAKYTDQNSEMFRKALFGSDEWTVEEMINLFHLLSSYKTIVKVYVYEEKLYDK